MRYLVLPLEHPLADYCLDAIEVNQQTGDVSLAPVIEALQDGVVIPADFKHPLISPDLTPDDSGFLSLLMHSTAERRLAPNDEGGIVLTADEREMIQALRSGRAILQPLHVGGEPVATDHQRADDDGMPEPAPRRGGMGEWHARAVGITTADGRIIKERHPKLSAQELTHPRTGAHYAFRPALSADELAAFNADKPYVPADADSSGPAEEALQGYDRTPNNSGGFNYTKRKS